MIAFQEQGQGESLLGRGGNSKSVVTENDAVKWFVIMLNIHSFCVNDTINTNKYICSPATKH